VSASLSAAATPVVTYSVPVNVPGGKPVMDVPAVPRSPSSSVGPVFVTLVLERTAKEDAAPRFICTH